MYLKNESVEEGRRAFDEMRERNVVSWTSLLTGYAQNGLNPNPFAFSAVIGALTDEGMVEKGIQVHKMVIKNGFGAATVACNSLINMYFKSGKIRDGRGVFDGLNDGNAVSWNSMVAGMLHFQVIKSGFEYDKNTRTTLMLAYSKCGEMGNVSKILALMDDEVRNVVSWSAMISGYLQNGMAEQARNLFCQLLQGENKGNSFMPGQLNQDSIMLYLLLVFFLPCIQREGTLKVHIKFSRGKGRGRNSTISGYAQHGYGRKALEIFEEMQKHNLKIDGVTFIGVISASTHTGLVDEVADSLPQALINLVSLNLESSR
ncbi:hypothetical protein Peur_035722 [Populus x canadensis]